MAKSKNKNGSSNETTGRPAPLINNFMETKLPSPSSKNSLFGGEKTREYFFFLPGDAKLYTTKNPNRNENNEIVSTWPIDDIASQTSSTPKAGTRALFTDSNPNSKGIPAKNFFKEEASAYAAAVKSFPSISVCIIKLVAPSKLMDKIVNSDDKMQRQIFPFELMPFVDTITEFTSKNKMRTATVHKKSGAGNEFVFTPLVEPETNPSPRKK